MATISIDIHQSEPTPVDSEGNPIFPGTSWNSRRVNNIDGPVPPPSDPPPASIECLLRVEKTGSITAGRGGPNATNDSYLRGFAYMKLNIDVDAGETFQWKRAPSEEFDLCVDTENQEMTVTPKEVDQGDVYVYCICWGPDPDGNWVTPTKNLILITDTQAFANPTIVCYTATDAIDPSKPSDQGKMKAVRVLPDPEEMVESGTISFNMSSEGTLFTGIRYMNTRPDLVGQWFVPEPDGSSREDLEFSFDGPGPTREQRLSTFRIKDWVTNDDTYVYLIEWEEDGQYFVCDPKIKNEPDVSHPPAGGELPCANPQGAFQNRP